MPLRAPSPQGFVNSRKGIEMASIEKRIGKSGARYRAKIFLGLDPQTGRKRWASKTHPTLKSAQLWIAEQEVARGRGLRVEPSKETLVEYGRRHLDDVLCPSVGKRTAEGYSGVFRRYIERPPQGAPLIGSIRLDQLRSESLQGYYGWLQRERGLSPGTIRSIHAVLRPILNHAARTGAIARSPAADVILPKQMKREVKAMTADQLRAFLEASQEDRYSALWFILVHAGMRPSEALALKWEDFDPEAGKLQVRRIPSRVPAPVRLVQPKTDRARRTIAIAPVAVAVLQEWKPTQAAARLAAEPEWSDLVFLSGNGKPLSWPNLAKNFTSICSRAGLGEWKNVEPKPARRPGPARRPKFVPAYRPYDLRHSAATLMARSGIHPKVISERLGHSSVAFTLSVYTGAMDDMQGEAAQVMQDILGTANG